MSIRNLFSRALAALLASALAVTPLSAAVPPTSAEADSAVPAAGTPNRSLTNQFLKDVVTTLGNLGLPVQHEWKHFILSGTTSWLTSPAGAQATIQGTVASVSTPFNTSYGAPRGRMTGSDAVVDSGVATARGVASHGGYMPAGVDAQRLIWEGLWAPTDTNTGRRWAAGLYLNNSGNPSASADPDAWTNVAVFGKRASDSNVQFITNDGTSTGAVVDLGANFPAASTTTLYFARITARGGGTPAIDYYIKNLVTGSTASGSVTSNIPVADSLLVPIMWAANGPTTASAVTFEASHQTLRLVYQGL